MPGFDKTGPQGKGPVTSGGRGICLQNEQTGTGRGRGRSRGRGAGAGGGRGLGQGGGMGLGGGAGLGRRQQPVGSEPQVNEQREKMGNDADATTEE